MNADLWARLREVAFDPTRATDMHADNHVIPLYRHVANDPLPVSALARAEARLRFALPQSLRELYTQVGDGNFGAGYGILPLLGGRYASTASSVVETYLAWRAGEWPRDYLPFCYHGCTVYSVIDLNTGRIGITDTEVYEAGADSSEFLFWQKDSLSDWLEA